MTKIVLKTASDYNGNYLPVGFYSANGFVFFFSWIFVLYFSIFDTNRIKVCQFYF